MWIIQNEKPTPGEPTDPDSIRERAYDKARKEFYELRLQQDVERQVAKEEALHYGAYFDIGAIERSLEKEDAAYEDWKKWALSEVEKDRHKQAGQLPGTASTEEEVETSEVEATGVPPEETNTATVTA
jgi:small subunit ribosomal protein S23